MRMKQSLIRILNRETPWFVFLLLGLVVFIGFFLANFWLGDDSFITFRTVDNFVNGYGLRWNTTERVQTYTNPLWMFYISVWYASIGRLYSSVLIATGLIAIVFCLVVMVRLRDHGRIFFALCLFFLSKSFMEYTSSGLENVLSYLLLALYFFEVREYLPRSKFESHSAWRLSLLFALIFLNRMDAILLVLLPQGYLLILEFRTYSNIRGWALNTGKHLLAFLPALLWLLFAIIYYGFLFPNTYYAKTTFDISLVRWYWVIGYYKYALFMDPIIIGGMVAAILVAGYRRNSLNTLFGIGIILYNIYIVRVGGDFMGGRFLTLPYLISVLILSENLKLEKFRVFQGKHMAIALLLFGVIWGIHKRMMTYNPFVSMDGTRISLKSELFHHVIDERLTLGQFTRVEKCLRGECFQWHPLFLQGLNAREASLNPETGRYFSGGAMGLVGFAAGPETRIIDIQGLCDPLLARMKGQPKAPGHIVREIPEGYDVPGQPIQNPEIRQYYEGLALITQGEIFQWVRFRAIWEYNLGRKRTFPLFAASQ